MCMSYFIFFGLIVTWSSYYFIFFGLIVTWSSYYFIFFGLIVTWSSYYCIFNLVVLRTNREEMRRVFHEIPLILFSNLYPILVKLIAINYLKLNISYLPLLQKFIQLPISYVIIFLTCLYSSSTHQLVFNNAIFIF